MNKARYYKGLKNFRGLSSAWLKIIAVVTMFIDHAAVVFIGAEPNILRYIGRIAFPIFAFMIAEGARRTSSSGKYLLRLLIFCFISEIPFDLACHGKILEFTAQNVFFTLTLGLLSIEIYKALKEKKAGFLGIFTTAVIAFAAMLLKTDYGAMGVILCTAFYFWQDKETFPRLVGNAVSVTALMFSVQGLSADELYIVPSEKWALFSLIPIMLYNGEKGFKINKYFFYAFYPAHLLILYLISLLIK